MCFNNKIFRGNRTIKNDAGSFEAFISPNLPPIATLEIRINGDVLFLFSDFLSVSLFPVPCNSARKQISRLVCIVHKPI